VVDENTEIIDRFGELAVAVFRDAIELAHSDLEL